MIGKLLCKSGIHDWTGRHYLPAFPGVRISCCSRCFLYSAIGFMRNKAEWLRMLAKLKEK